MLLVLAKQRKAKREGGLGSGAECPWMKEGQVKTRAKTGVAEVL